MKFNYYSFCSVEQFVRRSGSAAGVPAGLRDIIFMIYSLASCAVTFLKRNVLIYGTLPTNIISEHWKLVVELVYIMCKGCVLHTRIHVLSILNSSIFKEKYRSVVHYHE